MFVIKTIIMYHGVVIEKLESVRHLEQTLYHPYSKSYLQQFLLQALFSVKKDIFLFPKAGTNPPHKDAFFKTVVCIAKKFAKKHNHNCEKFCTDILLHVTTLYQQFKEK